MTYINQMNREAYIIEWKMHLNKMQQLTELINEIDEDD